MQQVTRLIIYIVFLKAVTMTAVFKLNTNKYLLNSFFSQFLKEPHHYLLILFS